VAVLALKKKGLETSPRILMDTEEKDDQKTSDQLWKIFDSCPFDHPNGGHVFSLPFCVVDFPATTALAIKFHQLETPKTSQNQLP